MAIALHSAALAAEMFLAGKSADEYRPRLRAQLGRSMSLAMMLSRAMITNAGRSIAPFGLSLFPNAMRWIAASTRIPEHAIVKWHASPSLEPTQRRQHFALGDYLRFFFSCLPDLGFCPGRCVEGIGARSGPMRRTWVSRIA